jgi:hypothetical protein
MGGHGSPGGGRAAARDQNGGGAGLGWRSGTGERLRRVGPIRLARPKGRIGQWVVGWGWRWPARRSGPE